MIDLVYPEFPICPGCGDQFQPGQIRLCKNCLKEIEFIREDYCLKCGKLVAEDIKLCRDCRSRERYFQLARAVGIYTGGLKEYITAFKYENTRTLAVPLGQLLAIYTRRFYDLAEIDVITYIPVHEERFEERGFNQAQLLASELGTNLDLPVRSLLMRQQATSKQSDLSREERIKNVQGIFSPTADDLSSQNILLVDDIFTTGATVGEASRVLLAAGVQSVRVITLATGKDFFN